MKYWKVKTIITQRKTQVFSMTRNPYKLSGMKGCSYNNKNFCNANQQILFHCLDEVLFEILCEQNFHFLEFCTKVLLETSMQDT